MAKTRNVLTAKEIFWKNPYLKQCQAKTAWPWPRTIPAWFHLFWQAPKIHLGPTFWFGCLHALIVRRAWLRKLVLTVLRRWCECLLNVYETKLKCLGCSNCRDMTANQCNWSWGEVSMFPVWACASHKSQFALPFLRVQNANSVKKHLMQIMQDTLTIWSCKLITPLSFTVRPQPAQAEFFFLKRSSANIAAHMVRATWSGPGAERRLFNLETTIHEDVSGPSNFGAIVLTHNLHGI